MVLYILILSFSGSMAQSGEKEVYLITCDPGGETYSIYGHSAIRIIDKTAAEDMVYNWGVFDFDTPNFNFKFARGKLDYKLAVYSYKRFLKEYFTEERSVYLQKVNLDQRDIRKLDSLLKENLKEENLYYRYDFLKDNCATRIRDIFEDVLEDDMIYPAYEKDYNSSYRKRLKEYQSRIPWLDAGADLLIGSPGDDKCGFRESMFLPDYLMWNLSEAKVNKGSGTYMLLEPPEIVSEFARPDSNIGFYRQPWFVLLLGAFIILLITFKVKIMFVQNTIDLIFFIAFSVLSVLMVFVNFFSEHDAMSMNFNLIWLNPLLLLAPLFIFIKKKSRLFWLVHISLSMFYLVFIIFFKQSINPAFIPLIAIIVLRSWYRLRLSEQL